MSEQMGGRWVPGPNYPQYDVVMHLDASMDEPYLTVGKSPIARRVFWDEAVEWGWYVPVLWPEPEDVGSFA